MAKPHCCAIPTRTEGSACFAAGQSLQPSNTATNKCGSMRCQANCMRRMPYGINKEYDFTGGHTRCATSLHTHQERCVALKHHSITRSAAAASPSTAATVAVSCTLRDLPLLLPDLLKLLPFLLPTPCSHQPASGSWQATTSHKWVAPSPLTAVQCRGQEATDAAS